MDVFDLAMATGGDAMRACAIAAGYDLALFDRAGTVEALADGVDARRLRILLDVLVAVGAMTRDGEVYRACAPPPRPDIAREGWGRLAEVIRSGTPLPLPAGRGYHDHLVRAGAEAARELAPHLAGASLLDLGGGAGTYTEAFLDAHPGSTATLVDAPDVIALAAERLARFGDRVTLVAGDARIVTVPRHATALLANVLHLHGEAACAELVAVALAASDRVVIKDLRLDEDRRGPLEGLLFALGMALYTDGGDVHRASQLRRWLGERDVVETRLACTDHLVLVAEPSRFAGLDMPPAFRRVLDAALHDAPELAAPLVQHYAVAMPAMRRAEPPLFAEPLDWTQLPRLAGAIDRLYAVLWAADVDPGVLGASTSDAFRARTPTLSALYGRTHYGGCMPLLYGYPADLAYFATQLSGHALIDRYLVAPIIHELSHLHREREGIQPIHLDECLGGWLGVHVHRELAYPAPGEDDALYGAPWLAQIGQAIARAFGVRAAIRAHAGIEPLPATFVAAAAALGKADWGARRTLHFLSDTFDPDPWVDLALAGPIPDDDAFDRRIVADALSAMCLVTTREAGSLRARLALPEASIRLGGGWLTTARRGEVDRVEPRYWLPPAIARLPPREVRLASLADIDATANMLVDEARAR